MLKKTADVCLRQGLLYETIYVAGCPMFSLGGKSIFQPSNMNHFEIKANNTYRCVFLLFPKLEEHININGFLTNKHTKQSAVKHSTL